MSLNIYHYIAIVIAVLLIRSAIKLILAFRYHFHFKTVGLFSISEAHYDHHPEEADARIWSIHIEKFKCRLRKTITSISQAPYVTIYISDVNIQIDNLSDLLNKPPKENTATTHQLNKQLSRIGSYLQDLSKWYSSSVIKPIIKFISALPAQFLMAGLANYVDIVVENVTIDIEGKAVFKVGSLSISSVLFTAMNSKKQGKTSSNNEITSLRRNHQRHSMKSAQHLFKEKFFEFTVNVGPIAFCSIHKDAEDRVITEDILSLSTGAHLSISCHFNAACVTLKDVDIETRIPMIAVQVTSLMQLIKDMSSYKKERVYEDNEDTHSKTRTHKPSSINQLLQLLKSVTVIIEDTTIEAKHNDCIRSRMILLDISMTGTVESHSILDPYYKLQSKLGRSSWNIYEESSMALEGKALLSIEGIDFMGMLSKSLILKNKNFSVFSEDILTISDKERFFNTEDLGPNRRFIDFTIGLIEPAVHLNTDNINIIKGLSFTLTEELAIPNSTPQLKKRPQLVDLPKLRISLSMERPHIQMIYSDEPMAGIGWDNISSEIACVYMVGNSQPTILASPGQESNVSSFRNISTNTKESSAADFFVYSPTTAAMQKATNYPRASWTNIFRRSLRPKSIDETMENRVIEWNYQSTFRIKALDMMLNDEIVEVGKSKSAFVLISDVECSLQTRCDVSLRKEQLKYLDTVWNPETNPISFDIKIDKPVLNWWKKTLSGQNHVEFWACNLFPLLKSSKKHQPETEQRIKDDNANSVLYKYLSILKINFSIKDLSIILEGVDKEKKSVPPDGYINNSPTKDVVIRLILAAQNISIVFAGSRLAGSKNKLSSTSRLSGSWRKSNDNEPYPFSLGIVHATFQHLTVHRIFKAAPSDESWHLLDENKNVVMWISRLKTTIDLTVDSNSIVDFALVITVKKMGIQYSLTEHYALLVVLLSTMNDLRPVTEKRPSTPVKQKRMKMIKLELQINRSDLHVFLPNETEIYVRIDIVNTEWDSQLDYQGAIPTTNIRNITLYGESRKKNGWEQLFEMDNLSFRIVKEVDDITSTKELCVSKIYFRIPYGYELSYIVDSMNNLVKIIKAFHSRLYKNLPFLYMGSSEKLSPLVVPHVRLKCSVFTFQFEDDPFETRLRAIWKTGLAEQENRIAIEDAFEMKTQALKKQPSDLQSIDPDNVTDERVNDAWQRLQEHNSSSWKRHIDAAMSNEEATFTKAQLSDYRHTTTNMNMEETLEEKQDNIIRHLSRKFIIDIIDLPVYPPLLDLTAHDISFDITPPDFHLSETRQFIYDVGKKQPIETRLSTLIPFHLNISSGKTWAQIRDYPIPLLLVPCSNNTSKKDGSTELLPAWSLSGNYVFADALGDRDATRRLDFTVWKTSYFEYIISITRTTSPMKFFSIVDIKVHNSGLSFLSFSVPYQPAFQDITRVIDSFTRPSVDPSQKVGFWDKIRLLIHTKAKISFVENGDLAIVMKGTRDPYDMSEKGFGLAKVWRNEVVCLLGHENSEGQVMQIISNDYAFGVPDLLDGGYIAPYILSADIIGRNRSGNKYTHIQQSSFNHIPSQKDLFNESRFIKIALKLSAGIVMGIGCHLERKDTNENKIDDQDMTPEMADAHKSQFLQFLPHYKVKFKAPQNVHEKSYDAYRGFRSDYIHLSLSIIKLNDDDDKEKKSMLGNSMHLTTGFIEHFVSWFRLFGGAMSYPLRTGTLFPKADSRPSQKFGRHMSTMKYKVAVNPLTVGYFLKDDNVSAEESTVEELGDCIGLKAYAKEFSVDMHQRREFVNDLKAKLDRKRLKANWPLHEAEVQLKNVDVRVVKAKYSRQDDETLSSSGAETMGVPYMDSHYVDHDNKLDIMEGLNYQGNNDLDTANWIDLDDYIEMEIPTPAIYPTIQVLPFAFSPCIYYLRQIDRNNIEKFRYLHKTHDCILGTSIGTREMQVNLLNDRIRNMDIQIRKHQLHLHNIESKIQYEGINTKVLEAMSDKIVDKTRLLYEKRDLIQRYLRELSTQSMPDLSHKENGTLSGSTIFGKDTLAQWEEKLGHFKVRYIVHNPQIIFNNSIRNILYHAMELRDHRRALAYYMTTRTIKFLRDLIESTDSKHDQLNNAFVLGGDEGGMDSEMVDSLIQKLLSEKESKFHASNETEEQNSFSETTTDEVDMSHSENMNNPSLQLKSIPDSYVMKSSYLVDLLNPQISLQSDCDPDNIVLVANERTQVKSFNVVDEFEEEAEMEMIKHRTIVSLDNVQFFVAKKEQFDSVDLLLDNHYGAKESDHWLAWIPPEMLINYVKQSEQFQRIGTRTSATVQYDKYNPLRLKIGNSELAHILPFEDRCNTVQVCFPKLELMLDSSQYNAIYQAATDLLLYKEPAKKERSARLREIMMAADRSSLYEVTEKIKDLQSRCRQLTHARDQYLQNMSLLDSKRIEDFKSIRHALNDAMEELYLGMEAVKMLQSNQRKDYHEPKTDFKFLVNAEKVVWKMLSKSDSTLSEWTITNLNFVLVNKEDHTSINTLEVDILQVKDTSPSAVFKDVLGPYYDSRKPYDFSRHKMLRCYFVSLAPVGGIPVIQHLEINLHPLRAQVTYNFGKAFSYYLFPPEKNHKAIDNAPVANSNGAGSSLIVPPDNESGTSGLPTSSSAMGISSNKYEKDCMRPANIPKPSESAPIILSSAHSDSSKYTMGSITSMRDDMELDESPSSSTLNVSHTGRRYRKNKVNRSKTTDDLMVMKTRASSNRTFILVKIPGTKHCLSYQGPKEKNIVDLRDFAFEQPTLEFRNETWSWFELMSQIKRNFLKAALLHNSKALLREKFLRRHPPKLIEADNSQIDLNGGIVEFSSAKDASLYEVDNASESSVESNDRDAISLHSSHSQESTWQFDPVRSTVKRPHLWPKFMKRDHRLISDTRSNNHQDIPNDTDEDTNSGRSKFTSIHPRQLQSDDQLIIKGKYLFGKYYNGPTHRISHR
ncbi:golgi-body localization protein domain-containing protein [Pilobolus umbonatus]|nr:golgi-body localization protein domain-containing protein [Pilobolus umbonatus]